MQMFIFDYNMKKNAEAHCNSHVCKIPMEIAQMLSTAHRLIDNVKHDLLFNSTHENTALCRWTRESTENYLYACKLAQILLDEYYFRYDTNRTKHKRTAQILDWCLNHVPNIKKKGRTPFIKAFKSHPELLKYGTVKAYRLYFALYKRHIAKWKKRPVPKWYK